MDTDLIPRPYEQGDENKIVPLLKAAFEKWPFFDIDCSPVEHWRWRYQENPLNKTNVVVIEKNEEIIACGHNILSDIKIYGKDYLGSYGTDHCVDPNYQGLGLSKKITEAHHELRKKERVLLPYMVTVNPKIIASGARKIAFPHGFPLSVVYLTRIEDINKHIQMKEVKQETLVRIRHILEKTIKSQDIQPNFNITVNQFSRFNEKIDRFFEKINKYYDFIIKKNRDYLNWRYCDPRAGKYVIKLAEDNEQILGYAICRINKLEEYHTGYIVELLTIPDRLDVAETLLLSSLQYFNAEDVNEVCHQLIKGHPYETLFNKYGFHGGEGGRRVFYNYMGEDKLDLEGLSPEKVYFSFGALTGI
jgi:hypothetical protein